MQMELRGILDQEKEFTFIIPAEHGLSYKKINRYSNKRVDILDQCWGFIDKSVSKGSRELIDTDDVVRRVTDNFSDLWVSVLDDKIVGCFIVGVISYPKADVINFEAIAGKFNIKYVLPRVEEHYKTLGYKYSQIIGRKGWSRMTKPLGYNPKNTTIFKRI
jgi:hypothetical protein